MCCMAQDIEHPILPALSHGKDSSQCSHIWTPRYTRTPRSRTNTWSLISYSAEDDNHSQWWRSCVRAGRVQEVATQELYGPRIYQDFLYMSETGVAAPMFASRPSRTGRVTATTLEHKGLTQTGVRKFINKSDEKDAAVKALEG